MKLERPLIFLDIESATLNPNKPDPHQDRIIEIAGMKFTTDLYSSDGDDCRTLSSRCNPGIPICKECSEIHGFTDKMVDGLPLFEKSAEQWSMFLEGCDLAGFGIWNYDLPLLVAELARCGIILDWRNLRIIDAGTVFKKKEERTLSAAVKFYCDREHTDAHGAAADAWATVDVFRRQLTIYPDLAKMTFPELHLFCQYDERLTLDGKIAKGPDGDPIYTFGSKTKGVKVKDDLGFAWWVLAKDFPEDTKDWLRSYMDELDSIEQEKLDKAELKHGEHPTQAGTPDDVLF